MEQKSDKETKPAYIKRVEKINPEKQLTDTLTKDIRLTNNAPPVDPTIREVYRGGDGESRGATHEE